MDDLNIIREQAQPLWYWINERHTIYLKRQRGEKPYWTSDPILKEYRFCNVFRELDTVTEWIRKNWREPYADHPNLWFMMATARLINWPGTLRDITDYTKFPDEFNIDDILKVFSMRRAASKKIFGGAYVITNGGSTRPKEEYVLDECLRPLWERGPHWHLMTDKPHTAGDLTTWKPFSLEEAWNWFRQTNGFGPFIAYEVVTDLRHTRYLRNAPDIMTWANAGPGAKRGLNRLAARPLEAPLSPQTALAGMRSLLAIANAQNSPLGQHIPLPLEMRDIEHSLCETDKYLRVVYNEGRPRARYNYDR